MDEHQLARALYQGLGRPHAQASRYGRLDHPEVLLHACLCNPVYDRLCSGTRAAYFQELIDLIGARRWFRDQILAALARPGDEMDEPQLREFAMAYARAGDDVARRRLYERVAEAASAGYIPGVCDLIDLDGPAAALSVMSRLGELVRDQPEALADDFLLDYIEREYGAAALAELLEAARGRGALAAAYVDYALAARAAERQAHAARPTIAGPRYNDLRDYLAQVDDRQLTLVRRWARHAGRQELRLAAEALLAIEDPRALLAHLAIFEQRRFPLSPRLLAPYAWHSDEQVARRSLIVLEGIRSADLRQLAFDLIAAGRMIDRAIGLLIANYRPGDEQLCRRLLDAAADEEAIHGIGVSLNDICAAHPTPAAADLLLAMYERGPCALCRKDTVANLIKLDALPAWAHEECRSDAWGLTRQLVAPA